MKKIKLRFSYFLIAELIAIIIQFVSYFLWGENTLVQSQITGSTSKEYFNQFMAPSYALIFAGVFTIIFACGVFMAAKKEQVVAKGSSILLGASQIVMICSLIVFLVFTEINRKTMYSNETNSMVLKVLASIKNSAMFVSSVSLVGLGLSFIKTNKNRKIGKICSYVFISVNALFVVSMIAVYFGAIATPSYALLSRFFETEQSLVLPYTCKNASMNGFTYGTTVRSFMLIQETFTPVKPGDYTSVLAGGVLSLIACISYVISIGCSFLALSGMLIESFDISRDEKPMEM